MPLVYLNDVAIRAGLASVADRVAFAKASFALAP